jgi:hypothetical protein
MVPITPSVVEKSDTSYEWQMAVAGKPHSLTRTLHCCARMYSYIIMDFGLWNTEVSNNYRGNSIDDPWSMWDLNIEAM